MRTWLDIAPHARNNVPNGPRTNEKKTFKIDRKNTEMK